MAHHRDLGQDLRSIADERRSPHRPRHGAILDQVRFAGREHELAVGDIHLTAPERHRVQPPLHRPDDLLGVRPSGQHKGVGHARQGDTLEAFPPAVSGQGNPHQPGVQTVGQIPSQDPSLDQHRATGRSALVVHVERPAPEWQRPVVHDRTDLRCHSAAYQVGEGGGLASVEVRFQPVTDRLMQQDPRPAARQHHRHCPGGGFHRLQVQDRLPRRFPGVLKVPIPLSEKRKPDTPATAEGSDLSIPAVFGDAGHL